MIKSSIHITMPIILKLFNHILNTEIYPQNWSKGFIIALFKNGDQNDPTNYRGITISNCIGKLFTKLLNTRLLNFLISNKIITKNQIGFMPGHRTADHILVLKTIIDTFKNKRKQLFLCFIDLRKAFDSVFHSGLIYKLMKAKLSSKYINLIQSMYSNITASINTTNGLTDAFPIKIGTRQGCNLSPTLFNIYINDLPKQLNKAKTSSIQLGSEEVNCLMYADDIVILAKSETDMKAYLHQLNKFCKKWRLSINTNKSKILIINRPKNTNFNFKIDKNKIEEVDSYCYLGITINKTGNFKDTIDKLLQKASRAYFSLRQEFSFQTNTKPRTIIKLFDSMVKPILLYCSEIWAIFGWTKNNIFSIKKYLLNANLKFEKLHSKMCRNTLGVHRKTTESLAKAELGRYPLMSNIIQNTYTYWQHMLESTPDQLLHAVLTSNAKETGKLNFTNRINGLLSSLNSEEFLQKQKTKLASKNIAIKLKQKYQNLYELQFFKQLNENAKRPGSGGRYEIYDTVKKNYRFENYLNYVNKGSLRRNISNIRLSSHNLPIERMRKLGIKRENRICKLCNDNKIGTEYHTIIECQNQKIAKYRTDLNNKITTINAQWNTFNDNIKFQYLMLACDKTYTFYFSIFLDKIYSETKKTYDKESSRTS